LDWGKVKFFLGEVLRNFTRNAGMQVTAIGTVAITIVLLGTFLFVRAALAGLGGQLLDQITISATVAGNASAAQTIALRRLIAADPRVASVEYVPKEKGWADLQRRLRGQIDTSLIPGNPLPDVLRVHAKHPEQVPAVAANIGRLSGIGTVRYGHSEVVRLLQLGDVLRRVGVGVIALFFCVAGIIIANTIRLTVFARRREISIMQLVGATNFYIRAPFICEGLLDGLVGTLLAVVVLGVARVTIWPKLVAALLFIPLNSVSFELGRMVAELFVVGGAVGIVASWIAVGRHLRT
jgi:cell division transport system permease protein